MTHKQNIVWIAVILSSLIGVFYLFNTAYANPLSLPDYAFTKPDIREAYEFAKTDYQDLVGLPCSCGCGTPEGATAHGSRVHERGLADCFMNGNINEGGIWDSHASECGLCYQDALYAKSLYTEGNSKQEVKEKLEEMQVKRTFSNKAVYKNDE